MNNAESESLCVTPPFFFFPSFFFRILIRLTAGIPEHSVAHEKPRPSPARLQTGVVCVKPTSLRFFFFNFFPGKCSSIVWLMRFSPQLRFRSNFISPAQTPVPSKHVYKVGLCDENMPS